MPQLWFPGSHSFWFSISRKAQLLFSQQCFFATSGDTCGPKAIGNAKNSKRFHGLGDAPGVEGDLRIIGNAKNLMHFHGLGDSTGVAGSPRNIGKALNTMHFHGLGVAVGGAGGPRARSSRCFNSRFDFPPHNLCADFVW